MSLAEALPKLPFVRMTLGSSTQFWAAQPAKDWSEGNALGRDYADQLLTCIRENDAPMLFGQVVQAIAEVRPWSGVEVGFMHRVAERAAQAQ